MSPSPKRTLQRERILDDERLRREAERLLLLDASHEESIREEEAAELGVLHAWHTAGHEQAEP